MGRFKYRAFLDTNILVDVLSATPRPSTEASQLIFEAVRSGIFEGFITTQSILDAAYILSRLSAPYDRDRLGRSILQMSNYLYIESIHIFDIQDAILHARGDLEDDSLFARADALGCDAVITSDRGFRNREDGSGPEFFTPEDFVSRLRGR